MQVVLLVTDGAEVFGVGVWDVLGGATLGGGGETGLTLSNLVVGDDTEGVVDPGRVGEVGGVVDGVHLYNIGQPFCIGFFC